MVARVGRGERQHAGGGVLAEEQGLGTFQDLDLPHVEEAFVDDPALTVIDPVHDHRDRLLDADAGGRRADAAQADGGAAAAAAARDGELRGAGGDLLDGAKGVVVELLARHGGDRGRDVLDILVALAGADDDFFQGRAALGLGLGGGVGGAGRRGGAGQDGRGRGRQKQRLGASALAGPSVALVDAIAGHCWFLPRSCFFGMAACGGGAPTRRLVGTDGRAARQCARRRIRRPRSASGARSAIRPGCARNGSRSGPSDGSRRSSESR